jgi:hypothetical protein
MNGFYPYYKVVSDLVQDYELDNDYKKSLEIVIVCSILSGSLQVYDQSGKKLKAPVQFTKESSDVLVDSKEVNRWLLFNDSRFARFVWTPRKQRGRPPRPDKSIPKLKADGTLQLYVKDAVQQIKNKFPARNVDKGTVAKQLNKTVFQGRNIGDEYLKRHITKSMWK